MAEKLRTLVLDILDPGILPNCDDEAKRIAGERREQWREFASENPDGLTDALVAHAIGDASNLHDAQRRALDMLARGESAFVVMGTGRGKSLIFQIHAAREALLNGGASVFVYPLRALIADQACHAACLFESFGLSAASLTGESSSDERAEVYAGLASGAIDVVLTTPEYLAFHADEIASCGRVRFLAVDEAHHLADGGVKLSSRELNHTDSQSVNTLLHTISDFERISDHSVNLLESAEEMHTKDIQFSQDARDELQVLEDAVQDILNRTTDAFHKGDLHLASKVEPLEAVVNELVRAIKAHHIARLQAGNCSIEYGFVLDDLLTNYERVCDHCSNVAVAQIEVAQDSFDTHAYLNELRHGSDTKESEEFHRRLDRYRERYLFPENQSAEDFDK